MDVGRLGRGLLEIDMKGDVDIKQVRFNSLREYCQEVNKSENQKEGGEEDFGRKEKKTEGVSAEVWKAFTIEEEFSRVRIPVTPPRGDTLSMIAHDGSRSGEEEEEEEGEEEKEETYGPAGGFRILRTQELTLSTIAHADSTSSEGEDEETPSVGIQDWINGKNQKHLIDNKDLDVKKSLDKEVVRIFLNYEARRSPTGIVDKEQLEACTKLIGCTVEDVKMKKSTSGSGDAGEEKSQDFSPGSSVESGDQYSGVSYHEMFSDPRYDQWVKLNSVMQLEKEYGGSQQSHDDDEGQPYEPRGHGAGLRRPWLVWDMETGRPKSCYGRGGLNNA